MKPDSGKTENSDLNSTLGNFDGPTRTGETTVPQTLDLEATIPIESTGDAQETIPATPGGDSGDLGETTLISSAEGTVAIEPTREWDLLPPPTFEPGEIVFGKYRLVEMLGEGGMGQVWLVENIQLDCKSALKLIKPEIAKSDKAWKRFKREAQVMAKLNHPSAVAVRDFARAQSVAYIEMEFVRGKSLDKLVDQKKGEPFPLDWIAPIVDQLCSLLQEAHDHVDEKTGKPRPIIHRDLKPSNLMLIERKTPGNDLKVLDFGIAKMADEDRESNLTGDAEFIGTAAYSSPEQIRSEAIDGRSDLYSLGVMLYQFLTGDLPFQGGARRALVSHLTEAPRPFAEANPSAIVPPEIEALVFQCLEKNVENRPQSARELRERFHAAIESTRKVEPAPQVEAPAKKPRTTFLLPLLAFGTLGTIAVGVALINKIQQPKIVNESMKVPSQVVTSAGPGSAVVIEKPRWEIPEGFEAVGEVLPDGPTTIVRKAGRVPFDRQPSGIYLPRGFEDLDHEGDTGAAPISIRRGTGAGMARFRRIEGSRFQMGNVLPDPNAESPGPDLKGNPILPHWVNLSSFYMQETEVTNGQIEALLKDRPGFLNEEKLKDWKRYRDLLAAEGGSAIPKAVVDTYPAIGLDWETAKSIAEAFGGLLPTEAQWEYAARSEGKPKPYATKGNIARKPPANLFYGMDEAQMPVTKFEKDVTDQGIHDMTGNVREWCRDGYEPNSKTIGASKEIDSVLLDPCLTVARGSSGPESIIRHGLGLSYDTDYVGDASYVVRGGSFQTEPDRAKNYQRDAKKGDENPNDLGFRVVIELPIVKPSDSK